MLFGIIQTPERGRRVHLRLAFTVWPGIRSSLALYEYGDDRGRLTHGRLSTLND